LPRKTRWVIASIAAIGAVAATVVAARLTRWEDCSDSWDLTIVALWLVASVLAGISIAFAMPRTRWRWLVVPLGALLVLVLDLFVAYVVFEHFYAKLSPCAS